MSSAPEPSSHLFPQPNVIWLEKGEGHNLAAQAGTSEGMISCWVQRCQEGQEDACRQAQRPVQTLLQQACGASRDAAPQVVAALAQLLCINSYSALWPR